jgi:tRNA-intron endonuclease
VQPANAILSNGEAVVISQREADSLSQDGYGSRSKSGNVVLTPIEALYLVEKERVEVTDESTRELMTFEALFKWYASSDELLWNRYLIYKDLRGRGFVIKSARGTGVEFQVYERGGYTKGEPAYYLHAIYEGMAETVSHLRDVQSSLAPGVGLKLAVVDRRGEIVYYGLGDLDFDRLSSEESE